MSLTRRNALRPRIFTLIIRVESRNRLLGSLNSDMTTVVTFRGQQLFPSSAATRHGCDANKPMNPTTVRLSGFLIFTPLLKLLSLTASYTHTNSDTQMCAVFFFFFFCFLSPKMTSHQGHTPPPAFGIPGDGPTRASEVVWRAPTWATRRFQNAECETRTLRDERRDPQRKGRKVESIAGVAGNRWRHFEAAGD